MKYLLQAIKEWQKKHGVAYGYHVSVGELVEIAEIARRIEAKEENLKRELDNEDSSK